MIKKFESFGNDDLDKVKDIVDNLNDDYPLIKIRCIQIWWGLLAILINSKIR